MNGRKRVWAWSVLLLSFALSVCFGWQVLFSAPGGAVDFQGAYYATRCLMSHHDPYSPSDVTTMYVALKRHPPPEGFFRADLAFAGFVYQPIVFPLIVPFVWMGWSMALRVWMVLLIAGLFTSGVLMWRVGARAAPGVAITLVCLMLANAAVSIGSGNPAGVAIALCTFAVWCFLEARYEAAGVVCLALSLLLKPHDSGLVWLYLLLAGGALRRRAWQSLAVTAVVGGAALIWVTTVAPAWPGEWKVNLAAISAPGQMNNPAALTAEELRITKTIVDLQSVVAVFWPDPRVYNPVAYTFCGLLLLVGAAATFGRRLTAEQVWLGLTSIAPLTLLVVYHRPYDARILLIAIPGCALLARRGGWIAKTSVALTTAAIFLTGDLTTAFLLTAAQQLHLEPATFTNRLLILLLTRTGVLALIAMSLFHVAAYVRAAGGSGTERDTLVAYGA